MRSRMSLGSPVTPAGHRCPDDRQLRGDPVFDQAPARTTRRPCSASGTGIASAAPPPRQCAGKEDWAGGRACRDLPAGDVELALARNENRVTAVAELALALGRGAGMAWMRYVFVLEASPSMGVLVTDDPPPLPRRSPELTGQGLKKGRVRATRCKSVPMRCPNAVGHEGTAIQQPAESATLRALPPKPSPGLEPGTPSLPWARRCGRMPLVCGLLPLRRACGSRLGDVCGASRGGWGFHKASSLPPNLRRESARDE